jgi:hypothetical protein
MRKKMMDALSDGEIEFLAGLKDKPVDFETYPPVFQTQQFVEYLVERGTISFCANDIQRMFRHAGLRKALADKPNVPSPSTIRKYVNNVTKAGTLPLRYDDASDCWLVEYPKFRIILRVTVQANNAFEAKDAVRSKLLLGNQIVSESVSSSSPWVVDIELSTRFTSRAAVHSEMMELMSSTATKWSITLIDGTLEAESASRPSVGRFDHISIKLVQVKSA